MADRIEDLVGRAVDMDTANQHAYVTLEHLL